jgi:hypothetical protein
MEISFTLDRIEGDRAVLLAPDKSDVIWPKIFLPKNIKEGDILHFKIIKNQEANEEKETLAKNILNEIMNK